MWSRGREAHNFRFLCGSATIKIMTNQINPGWYPDPEDSSIKRYWDGQAWLDLPVPGPAVASEQMPVNRPRRGRVILAAVIIAVLLAGGVVAWKIASDHQAAQAQAEIERAEAVAAEEEADEEREAERVRMEELEMDAERARRAESVVGIEDAISKMAKGHIADGIIEGSVISVTCNPAAGGSTDDLTAQTTVFECFVATEDNGDETLSGHYYNSTMNWDTGSYTYGIGE